MLDCFFHTTHTHPPYACPCPGIPTPFPIELAEKCIAATEAQIVLDPFMGSGTTAAAAQNLGRDWIGMDISEAYCRMASERIFYTAEFHQ